MKRITITITIVIVSVSIAISQAQTIRMHFPDSHKGKTVVTVAYPYKGFQSSRDLLKKEYTVDASSSILLKMGEYGKGLYRFSLSADRFTLLLFPDDSLDVIVRKDSNGVKCTFTGTNAKGHELWMKYTTPRTKLVRLLDSLCRVNRARGIEGMTDAAMGLMERITSSFDSLRRKELVSAAFAQSASNQQNSSLGWNFMVSLVSEMGFKWEDVRPFAKKMLDYVARDDTSFYPDVIRILDSFYSNDYYTDTSDRRVSTAILPHSFQQVLYLPESIQEFRLADLVYFYASYGYDDSGWEVAYRYYKKQYPKTELSAKLDSLIKPFLNKKEVVEKTFLDKSYATLDELLGEFKGSYLFIDLWATWCMPCRQEMRRDILKPLERELDKRRVKKLYLSIDEEQKSDLWKKTADILKLSGYHHRVGKSLYSDIQQRIYESEPFGIPRYLFIGKNGRLLSRDLPRPSTGQKLLDEIDRLIKEDKNNQ